jgi:type III secretion protein S
MTSDVLPSLLSQALTLAVVLSMPAMVISAAVGLLVALFQAITSLQDSSVSQTLKLLAVSLTVIMTAPWAGQRVMAFFESLIQSVFTS